MRDYGKPASNQCQLDLPGFTQEGQELMEDARRWVGRHFAEWAWYKTEAKAKSVHGKVSPNLMLQLMRDRYKLEIPNAYAPCFARIAMEQDSLIRFRTAASKVDGFTEARL